MKAFLTTLILLAASTASAQVHLDVTLSGKTLDVRDKAYKIVASYAISPGLPKHPTPAGNFTIRRIVWNPAWVPPNKGWAKGKKAAAPGSRRNPIKVVKIFFKEPDYYIHGTADEHLLGDPASHGCIRMASTDAYALARHIQENGGAGMPEAWYQDVIGGKRSVTVRLPRPVPIAIRK